MNLITRFWRSSLGKKYVMALTGAALFVFLIGHLVGNLQVFGHPDLINGYAHFPKSKPGLLWGARLGLLGCVGLHIAAAVTLLMANKAARPEGYAGKSAYGSTLASRWMPMSGLVVLAFIVYGPSLEDMSELRRDIVEGYLRSWCSAALRRPHPYSFRNICKNAIHLHGTYL